MDLGKCKLDGVFCLKFEDSRASFGNLIFGLGAGPPPKFWPARQQLLSCQQFFIKSRARSRSRFIKIGHTVSAQIKVEGRKRVCRSLTFATSTGIYHTIGAFKECSFLLIDGQFSLSQDVTKFMWRSCENKIREIRFPKPTQAPAGAARALRTSS